MEPDCLPSRDFPVHHMHMADEGAEHTLSNLRRRRGAVRGSITRLGGRLKDLEGAADRPDVGVHAKQLASRIDTLDGDFKTLHFQIVDLISDENGEELGKEQDTLDKHEDDVSSLLVRLHQLLEKSHSPSNPGNCKALSLSYFVWRVTSNLPIHS